MPADSDARVDDASAAGMLRWHATYRPNAVAVVCGGDRLTYRDLDARSEALARSLLDVAGPGARVAVLLPNCIEYLELYQAAAKSGITLVPINSGLTEPEVHYILGDSRATLLVTGAEFGVTAEFPTIQVGGLDSGYEQLIRSAPEVAVERPGPDAVFFQGYTSGTTGRPKGCVQTLRAFTEHFRRSFYLYRHDADDVMLMPGPLFHEAPALFSLAQLFYGGTVVVLPRFDADDALQAIEREAVTIIGFAVPTMLSRMLAVADRYDTTGLRRIVTAGAPLHPETMDGVLRAFASAELHEFYGGTEIGIITNIEHRRGRVHGSSVGQPIPGCSVVLLDDDDKPVDDGEIGQIYVTPVMMAGYFARPDATSAATRSFAGVDWLTLGDLGRLEGGHLLLVDRKSHMIITGGENVYPAEVEAVLIEHPDVIDVAVIGLPDPVWGEAVTAVVMVEGHPPDVESLRAFSSDRLAGYKRPRRVEVVEQIPRTASGKILKHQLRTDLTSR
jgi:acyl-CoA synthetase (AMP-forming)/AMP-acid ligase II